ncbi:MAG TPA: PD-(D/E)XK nuclease family protein [Opitutaceae bacterium]|nr:PD-(D/E)XK nuclease family protein [Opitutaceae bacterium]
MSNANAPHAQAHLLLFRQAENAWRQEIRPWLERSHGKLIRSYVVVATRGQAYGLKQRCLRDGVPLLGVEFLTPGLARKKWLPLHLAENPDEPRSSIGRELLMLGLRILIEGRLKNLTSEDAPWGFWKSVQSDPERVLDDFDELLKAGFRENDFSLALLRELFRDLRQWVEQLGYDFAALQSERAALKPIAGTAKRVGGRLLIYGLTAEIWTEFSNVAALARRFTEITALLPDAEFRGKKALDENWIELWQALLGTEARPIDEETLPNCEAVAALGGVVDKPLRGHRHARPPCRVVVGRTRRDEMFQVAEEIDSALQHGAEHVGVIFPAGDFAYATLVERLAELRIQFHTTIDLAGTSDLDTQTQRALIRFYQRGARLEEFVELWPLLKQLGKAGLPLGRARKIVERLFDEKQNHSLAACLDLLEQNEGNDWKLVAGIARTLLPNFPDEITIRELVERYKALCLALDLPTPSSLETLRAFGERETRGLPTTALLGTLLSLIPEGVAAQQSGESSFARVTLLTRRRAEGLNFSHLILVESNAGVWPRRIDASPWLTDEHREALKTGSRFTLSVFTSDDRVWLEKRSYAALMRDTSTEVIFSAALFDENEPDKRLAPNSWVERALWSDPDLRAADRDIEQIFSQLAVAFPRVTPAAKLGVGEWLSIWQSRRNPEEPFDEYFFSVPAERIRPTTLTARLIERAVKDPAELWFDAVLKTARVEWGPLLRARRKALGQWAHRVLSFALQPGEHTGELGAKREPEDVRLRLRQELERLRANWPLNRYWDSFFLELSRYCERLLGNVEAMAVGGFVATELPLPRSATVPIGRDETLHVSGRVDLAFFDRPEWEGATVDIIDFKTGADAALSPERMAAQGFALQLGVYLAAANSLGVREGRVTMLKPEVGGASTMDISELPKALFALRRIGEYLRTGIYGALTPDPSEYAPEGRAWPLACVPIPEEILEAKYAKSFPPDEEVDFE